MTDQGRGEARQGDEDSPGRGRGRLRAHLVGAILLCALGLGAGAAAQDAIPRMPSPEGARAYFVTPRDGWPVSSPVLVRFGLSGMGVAPAGVKHEGTGHFHLVIDAETPKPGAPIPADPFHLHFGKGQTEAQVELSLGRHQLQIVMADHLHVMHDPPVVSSIIQIEVVAAGGRDTLSLSSGDL